jgi:hypothetical protein
MNILRYPIYPTGETSLYLNKGSRFLCVKYEYESFGVYVEVSSNFEFEYRKVLGCTNYVSYNPVDLEYIDSCSDNNTSYHFYELEIY